MATHSEDSLYWPKGPELGREMSRNVVLMHLAVADQLGLNPTDLKIVDLIIREGAMTAGQLAEETGLTSGAITGCIDRLEEARFVTRQRDQHDRRVVYIEAVEEGADLLHGMFHPLVLALDAKAKTFSPDELATVERYMKTVIEILQEYTQSVRMRASE